MPKTITLRLTRQETNLIINALRTNPNYSKWAQGQKELELAEFIELARDNQS